MLSSFCIRLHQRRIVNFFSEMIWYDPSESLQCSLKFLHVVKPAKLNFKTNFLISKSAFGVFKCTCIL
jgi:hypothetical protein